MDDPARGAGGALGDYTLQGSRERPMADVFRDIITNVQEMIRSEVRLARVEIREETSKTMRAGAMLGAGAVMALFAAGFLLTCIAQFLSLYMPDWGAALVVAVLMGIPGAVLIMKGRERLRVPMPEKTIENVKENVEWMKNQTR
jgi:uncharacterized membrane protein YqjE